MNSLVSVHQDETAGRKYHPDHEQHNFHLLDGDSDSVVAPLVAAVLMCTCIFYGFLSVVLSISVKFLVD